MKKQKKKALYTYRFVGGGYNQTYAFTLKVAIRQAKEEFPTSNIDEKSFKRITDQKEQDAYYRELQMMFN